MKISIGQKTKIKKIAKKYKLKLIIAFGSYVTGKIHKKSDMDIAVLTGPAETGSFKKYFSLLHNLNEVFPDNEIDLCFINRADPLFLYKICSNPFLLYGNIRRFNELRLYSFKRYIDYQPFFKIEEKFVKNFITEYASR